MSHAADLNCILGRDKEESIVADPKAKFFPSLERLNISFARLGKTMQRRQNTHSCGFIKPRTSALAGLVQTIRFIAPCYSARSLLE